MRKKVFLLNNKIPEIPFGYYSISGNATSNVIEDLKYKLDSKQKVLNC